MGNEHEDGPSRGLMAEVSGSLLTDYAGVMRDANADFAEELGRMRKSVQHAHLRLVQGGLSLVKAVAGAAAPKAPKVPGEDGKIDHPGSRGGTWYRDDKGNVRYGTKPTARYHSALSEDETAKLHENLTASIGELSDTHLQRLATTMGVDGDVLQTLRMVSQQAASQGLDPHDCFAETYALSFSPDGNLDATHVEEGKQLYGEMVQAYKEATQSDKWKKAAKISLARQRQQAVNAAQAVDRQRPLVQGHFEQLLSGNIAHESIKGLGLMHDMGVFHIPKTLSEAKQYTPDIDEARKLVGKASIDGERLGAIMKFGDALEPEQQAALVATSMLGDEQNVRMDDPLYDRDSFWAGQKDSPALDELRDLLKGHNKTYTDAEWDQVKDRTLQLARNVSDQMAAYNENQGGHIFSALFHNTTSLKKLFTDPGEVDRLHETEAEVRTRVERALKAQTDYDHPLEPNITAAMKQIGGPDGDMFGYQKAAVSWMKEIKSGVLAYDAGTGKTPISIAFVSSLIADKKAKRGIMVLPANLVAQWPKEIEKFRPGSKVQVISADSGSVEDRLLKLKALNSGELEADFVILSAGTVGLHRNTQDAIDNEAQALSEKQGKKSISKEDRARLVREGSFLENDPLVQELKNLDGAMMFDECFVAGTQVGGRNIEDIRVGDSVPAYDEATGRLVTGRVTRLFKKAAQSLVRVRLEASSRALVCTPNHPFMTQRGWVPAGYLLPSDRVLSALDAASPKDQDHGALHHLQRTCDASGQAAQDLQENRQGILLRDVPPPGYRSIQQSHHVGDQSKTSLRAHAPQQPDAQGLCAGENVHDVTRNGLEAARARWQRHGSDSAADHSGQTSWLEDGARDRRQGAEDSLLQGRHCLSGDKAGDRGGRHVAQPGEQKDPGSAQDHHLGYVGLAGVEIYEQAGDGRFGGLCPDGFVYNLEVENFHTYVVNNVVVHNCHHAGQGLKDPTNTHHLIARHIMANREYKFGMTATPMPDGPEDLFHLSNLFHPGSAGESMAKFNSSLVQYDKTFDPDTGEAKVVPVSKDMKELAATKRSIAPYVFFQRKTGKKVSEEMAAKGMALPKLNSVAHALSLTPESREIYNRCTEVGFDEGKEPLYGHPDGYLPDKQMYDKIAEEHGTPQAEMVMKMRGFVRQQRAAISPKLLDKSYTGPSPKIDESIDIIKRHFADPANADKPVVIFGSWMDSLDLMHDELEKAGVPRHLVGKITGQVSVEDRDVVQDAVNAGKLKVVLIGIKAGGAGLNLQKKAFRNIFLDKPWTPADMEQAVGRTWRTGAKADTVHIHHMKVAGTVDDRKYEKLGQKTQLVDSLSFADQSEDYLGGMVAASLKRLVGDFDKDVTEFTPAQHEQLMAQAGLSKNDVPFDSIPALREQFSLQDFGAEQKHQRWKETGDEKIKELTVMNDLKLKQGSATPAQHRMQKQRIGRLARKWIKDAQAASDHPVARYAGEAFHMGTEAQNSILARRPDFDPAKKIRRVKLKGKLPPALPIDTEATKAFGAQSLLRWAGTERPLHKAHPQYHMWEVLRRTRPASVSELAQGVASGWGEQAATAQTCRQVQAGLLPLLSFLRREGRVALRRAAQDEI